MLNSSEFKPYIVFVASPSVDELTQRQNEAPSSARKMTVRKPSVLDTSLLKKDIGYQGGARGKRRGSLLQGDAPPNISEILIIFLSGERPLQQPRSQAL
jgi:hypothetical protein